MSELNFSITASLMLEYLYCPRFTYFEYVLDIPQNEGKRFKVEKGRDIHEKIRKLNPDYLRINIGVVEKKSDIYLASSSGIRGVIDEILLLSDGTAAPLDYKYAEYKNKVFKTYKFQLIFYAKLIKENYGKDVNKGFLVYTRTKNKLVEVSIKDKDFSELDRLLEDIDSVIRLCRYPEGTKILKRCPDCCYKNICEKQI